MKINGIALHLTRNFLTVLSNQVAVLGSALLMFPTTILHHHLNTDDMEPFIKVCSVPLVWQKCLTLLQQVDHIHALSVIVIGCSGRSCVQKTFYKVKELLLVLRWYASITIN